MDSITDICYDYLPNKEGRITEEFIKPLEREIEKLKSENAELKSRLEKSIELPCKVGDYVNLFRYNRENKKWVLIQDKIKSISITLKGFTIYTFKKFYPIKSWEYDFENISEFPYGLCDYYISKTQAEAEKALEEMELKNES